MAKLLAPFKNDKVKEQKEKVEKKVKTPKSPKEKKEKKDKKKEASEVMLGHFIDWNRKLITSVDS